MVNYFSTAGGRASDGDKLHDVINSIYTPLSSAAGLSSEAGALDLFHETNLACGIVHLGSGPGHVL